MHNAIIACLCIRYIITLKLQKYIVVIGIRRLDVIAHIKRYRGNFIIFTFVCGCVGCFGIHFDGNLTIVLCCDFSGGSTNRCNLFIIAVKTNHIGGGRRIFRSGNSVGTAFG